MSIFAPSHLSVVTERSDASVIHQNFVKLHADLQSIKRYVKNVPISKTTSTVSKTKQESEAVFNLLHGREEDGSFEHYAAPVGFFQEIKPDIYFIDPYLYGPLSRFFASSPFSRDLKSDIIVPSGKIIKTQFGYTALVVDGAITDLERALREGYRNAIIGTCVPYSFALRSIQAEYSGGYCFSVYVSAYTETEQDGRGTMKVNLVRFPEDATISVIKTWSFDFPVVASEKYKWTRHDLIVLVQDIPNHLSQTERLFFFLEFASTTPYLIDALQFIPFPEPRPFASSKIYSYPRQLEVIL